MQTLTSENWLCVCSSKSQEFADWVKKFSVKRKNILGRREESEDSTKEPFNQRRKSQQLKSMVWVKVSLVCWFLTLQGECKEKKKKTKETKTPSNPLQGLFIKVHSSIWESLSFLVWSARLERV